MSENVVICTECGRERPKQVLVCGKHDFRHEEGTHCDHCENEVAALLEAQWKTREDERKAQDALLTEANAKAKADAAAKAAADAAAKAAADAAAKGANESTT